MSPCDSGEEEEVVSFQLGGEVFLRSETDILYDPTTHDAVGIYVPGEDGKEGTIVRESG